MQLGGYRAHPALAAVTEGDLGGRVPGLRPQHAPGRLLRVLAERASRLYVNWSDFPDPGTDLVGVTLRDPEDHAITRVHSTICVLGDFVQGKVVFRTSLASYEARVKPSDSAAWLSRRSSAERTQTILSRAA